MKKWLLSICLAASFAFSQTLETVFEDSTYQLTGVAVSKSGRLFTCYPHWDGPYRDALVEIRGGEKFPYPDTNWSRNLFSSVQAVVIDSKDRMWVVEPRARRILQIDLRTDSVKRTWSLDSILPERAYLNDIRVDAGREVAYVSNSGEGGGIAVLSLRTERAHLSLQNQPSVLSDTDYVLKSRGKALEVSGKPYRANVDGIALSPDGKFLYYKSLSDDRLFRIPTFVLRNAKLSADMVERNAEFLGRFVASDGMAVDSSGNLFLGDLENRRIVKISPELEMSEVVPPSEGGLPWPDSYQIADGYLYISCSRIDDEPRFHGGAPFPGPFLILRLKL